jgi:hypothetical protein
LVREQLPAVIVNARFVRREKGAEKTLHQVERLSQEQMILACAALDAGEQRIVLLNQRFNQPAIIFGQTRKDFGKFGFGAEAELLGEFVLAGFAGFAGALNDDAFMTNSCCSSRRASISPYS